MFIFLQVGSLFFLRGSGILVDMKKLFLVLSLAIASSFLVSCSTSDANAGNVDSNANAAEQPKTEAPAYSDAASALEAGNKYFDENLTEKAIEAYKFATNIDPDLGEAHFKLGLAYALLESEQELIAMPVDPSNSNEKPDPKDKSKKEEKKSNSTLAFEDAVKAYKKQLKENPKDGVAHFNLGRVLDRLNEDEDSRKSFEEAVKLSPEDSQYRTELGAILIKLAQYDEAVRSLKKALDIDSTNGQAIELLDKAQAGKKRVDFGAEALKKKLGGPENSSDDSKGSTRPRKTDDDEKDSKESPPLIPESDKKKDTPKTPAVPPKKPA